MYDQILTLIKRYDVSADAAGDQLITKTRRDVFCNEFSVGSKEFWQAQADDFQPELKLVLADYLDYEEEQLAEYGGIEYHILRHYRNGKGELELTLGRRVNRS